MITLFLCLLVCCSLQRLLPSPLTIWSLCWLANCRAMWPKKLGYFSSEGLVHHWMKLWISTLMWYGMLSCIAIKNECFLNFATKYLLFLVDPQHQSAWPIFPWCHWRGESQQLQCCTAYGCGFHHQMVPDQAQTVFVISDHSFPLHSQFQEL